MPIPAPYKLKRLKKDRPPLSFQKPQAARDAEQLTGAVNGMRASDLEERFSRSLEKFDVSYYFRIPIGDIGQPGWKELDFLIFSTVGVFAIQIDDIEFVHKGTQTTEDAITDIIIMEKLKQYGIREITHITSDRLATQALSDSVVRSLIR